MIFEMLLLDVYMVLSFYMLLAYLLGHTLEKLTKCHL